LGFVSDVFNIKSCFGSIADPSGVSLAVFISVSIFSNSLIVFFMDVTVFKVKLR
jgi:hypothetical protein